MSSRIWVGTRKGLFSLNRRRGASRRWAVSHPHFLGDPVNMVFPDSRDGMLYAALDLGHFGVKLRRSADGGKSWTEIAVPAYPAASGASDGAPAQGAPALELMWALESADSDQPGSLWAGTIPGGLFRSRDRGDSWELVRGLWDRPERAEWSGGGYDHPGIHSVCVDPRDSRRVTVGVSTGGVWQTADGGENWQVASMGMRAAYMPPEASADPNVQDVHRLVQGPSHPEVFWAQHHNGIFRSTDGSKSWSEITTAVPSNFGFAAAVHPADANTAWFVPAIKDERRVPVDGRLVVSRTRDGGRTFEALSQGLPAKPAYDLVYRHGLAVDATGERLAMGSTTGGLWISEDGGDSWMSVATRFPPIYCVCFAAD